MKFPITEEFKDICREIIAMDHSLAEWAEIESDDMFQMEKLYGGFDADAMEFIFTYFDEQNVEYYFSFSLPDIQAVLDDTIAMIELVPAD